MSSDRDYNAITAKHYAAYRPPLHSLILGRCLKEENKFHIGLDIGCGTGQSSIALSRFCDRVIGIDPSTDMLSGALAHPQIEYVYFDQEHIQFPDNYFNIGTMAGSLFYAKSQKLLGEIQRVLYRSSPLIVYDFEILFQDLYSKLSIDQLPDPIPYNYKEDFSGLYGEILPLKTSVEKEFLYLRPDQVAHLILSVRSNYEALEEKYQAEDPFPILENQLKTFAKGDFYPLEANLYYTTYKVTK